MAANPSSTTHASKQPVAANPLDRETFGQRLRSARKTMGWTLQQVAAVSGISVTTISRVERGQLALSYEKFYALAQALQMDLAAMFRESGAPARSLDGPVLTRSGQGVAYRGAAFTYEFLVTQAEGKQMSPALGTVHARRINGPADFASHPGEEFVYVLRGALEVHFATGEVVALRRGDTLYFDSRIGHAYISTSRAPAITVGACTGERAIAHWARP